MLSETTGTILGVVYIIIMTFCFGFICGRQQQRKKRIAELEAHKQGLLKTNRVREATEMDVLQTKVRSQ